jgi:hypothetical protein
VISNTSTWNPRDNRRGSAFGQWLRSPATQTYPCSDARSIATAVALGTAVTSSPLSVSRSAFLSPAATVAAPSPVVVVVVVVVVATVAAPSPLSPVGSLSVCAVGMHTLASVSAGTLTCNSKYVVVVLSPPLMTSPAVLVMLICERMGPLAVGRVIRA